jgi:hypothetical protein
MLLVVTYGLVRYVFLVVSGIFSQNHLLGRAFVWSGEAPYHTAAISLMGLTAVICLVQ